MRKLTQDDFLRKAYIKHQGKYDYSLVNYVSYRVKVKIICKRHGSFYQTPAAHLVGNDCPKCAREITAQKKSNTQDYFLDAAFKVHGNFYDYTKTVYTKLSKKVIIICPVHGEFEQIANNHLSGYHCNNCYKEKLSLRIANMNYDSSLTRDQFIEKAQEKHSDKYVYDLVNYTNSYTPVKIICFRHGIFEQTPNSHLSERGCIKCGYENGARKKSFNTQDFIEISKIVHENKYDYSLVEYFNCRDKVTIICPYHKEFKQRPNSHMRGFGCRLCSHFVSKSETLWLNYLKIPNENRNILIKLNSRKFNVDALVGNTIYEFYGDYFHGNLNKFNPEDMNKLLNKTFQELYNKTINREKILKTAGYEIISIWEMDWKRLNI